MELAPNGRPRVEVKLIGEDGNAFAILGRVQKAMKRAGWSKIEIDGYYNCATRGDYDNLLRVTMQYVTEGEFDED